MWASSLFWMTEHRMYTMWNIARPYLLIMVSNVVLLHGHRILMLPGNYNSHVRQFTIIGDILLQDGHQVYMGLSETFPPMEFVRDSQIKLIRFAATYKDFHMLSQPEVNVLIKEFEDRGLVNFGRRNDEILVNMCLNPLADDTYFQTLKTMNFDLAIVDVAFLGRCLLIVPYNLGIPIVSITTVYEPWLIKTPALPSFVPTNALINFFTDKMTFYERLINLGQNIDWIASPRMNILDDGFLKKYIRTEKKISLNEIAATSLLFLIDMDPVLDYPRPAMPNEINIGGLSLKAVKPLPDEMKEIMGTSEFGVIVMSFGSFGFHLPPDTMKEYLRAFSQIKYTVIWSYNGVIPNLAAHVKTFKWFPQSDLLAHPNTKLFLTHCGNGGQFEAMHHGVPMVGLPVFGDQPYNCKRIEALGYGICLGTPKVKADLLVEAIEEVINNDTYSKNIKLASSIYRDNPQSAAEKLVHWVNHVLKFGGKHLHSHALDMPWYEYLMLDIFGFLLFTTVFVIVGVSYMVHLVLRCQRK